MAFTYGTVRKCTTADGSASNVYEVRFGYELVELGRPEDNPSISTIKLQLEVRSTSSQYKPYGYNQTTTIDGTQLSTKSFDLRSTNTWQVWGTRTIQVEHNSDGSYSANKSGSFTTNVTGARPKTGNASVDVVLPTIPKASQITVSNADIGSSTSIVINKASDSFTTTLQYVASGMSDWATIVEYTPLAVYGWTVPTSLYDLIPNNPAITCVFKATTYSGNTWVGETTTSATFIATAGPIINSITLEDINSTTTALTGDSSKMIRYASLVRVSVNATAQYSASISSIFINGVQANEQGYVDFAYCDTNNFNIVVKDSRNIPTTHTATMTMVDYIPLTINQNIRRNQPTDGKINIDLSGNWFNGNFGNQSNTLEVRYRYKEYGAGSWEQDWTSTGLTGSIDGNNWSATGQLSGMTYTKSYQFEVKAYDRLFPKDIEGIVVPRGVPVYNWDNDEFDTNVRTNINNDLEVTGAILATNGVNFLDGHNRYVYWKENGYGDKFGISPAFTGYGDDNKLRIRGAVGGQGTDPEMYDLATISAESGSAWLKGGLSIDGNLRTNRSYLYTLNAGADFSGRHYTLVNIPADDHGENSISVNIRGIIGDWVYDKGIIDLQISNRGGLRVYGTFYGDPNTFAEQRIVIFEESDGSHTVYLYCVGVYEGPSTLQITWGGSDNALPTIYTDNRFTYSPSGNNVWESWLHTVVCLQTRGGTGIVTRSSGSTLESSSYARFGNVVTLNIQITSTSSTSAGNNTFTGTINDSALFPKLETTGLGYHSSSGLLGVIDTSGNIIVRVIGGTLNSGLTTGVTFTYVV